MTRLQAERELERGCAPKNTGIFDQESGSNETS
jgi:hypothetical protein